MNAATGATRAYHYLRQQLLEGRFQPGTRLLYGPIGKEIGVSATPVREAAGRLANEGLVELVPQRGAVVREISREEMAELYEVRLGIEPYAAGLAAKRITASAIKDLQGLLDQWSGWIPRDGSSDQAVPPSRASEFDRNDQSFHQILLDATGNRSLIRASEQSQVLTRIFGVRRHVYTRQTLVRTFEQHEAIQRAVAAGNAPAAIEATRDHIELSSQLSLGN